MRAKTLGILAVLSLLGCSSGPPPPPEKKVTPLSAEVSDKIDRSLESLNNDNRNEKYLKDLIAAGESGDQGRQAVIDRTCAAIRQSYADPHAKPTTLKAQGRRRAIEALDKVAGDDSQALEIFRQCAKDGDSEVAAAAAAALASRGDEGSFASLLQAVKLAKGDRPTQDRAVRGLLRLVKPDKKDQVLTAIDAGSREALAPVVSAVLPGEPEPRAQALAQIVKEHPNAQARIAALDQLRGSNDPETVDFARSQANADDADLRAYSLRLLAAQGGKVAALQLAEVLATEHKDADLVAKLLSEIDAPEAPGKASDIVQDASKPASSRAACARQVLVRLKDENAPEAFKDPASRERGLAVLRRAIKDPNDKVAAAAIEALGGAGDESDAEALAELLAATPQQGAAIAKALGRIGGPFATQTLVNRLGTDTALRGACRDALASMKGLKTISFDDGFALIQLLRSSDLETRKSALAVLKVLKGDSDVHDYNPQADVAARARSIERWVAWWRDKVAQRGG